MKAVDGSFHVHSTDEQGIEISTLCSLDQFYEGSIVFISDKKYFNRLLDKLDSIESPGTIGIVFQESFFKIICQEQLDVLNQFRFYATGNVPEKAVYGGYPARPLKEFLKSSATLRRLSLGKKKLTGQPSSL